MINYSLRDHFYIKQGLEIFHSLFWGVISELFKQLFSLKGVVLLTFHLKIQKYLDVHLRNKIQILLCFNGVGEILLASIGFNLSEAT